MRPGRPGGGLLGLGAAGEDVQDDFLAVDDGQFGEFFPVALLAGAEIDVENDDIGLDTEGHGLDLLGLARAEVKMRRGAHDARDEAADDLHAHRVGQAGQLVQMLLGLQERRRGVVNADQEGALGRSATSRIHLSGVSLCSSWVRGVGPSSRLAALHWNAGWLSMCLSRWDNSTIFIRFVASLLAIILSSRRTALRFQPPES